MKKAKNIILLSGIICNVICILWNCLSFFIERISVIEQLSSEQILQHLINGLVLPNALILILMILPVVLFVLNLKNKSGKVLPIVSFVFCGLIALYSSFFSVTPAIPKYLLLSELALIDTYWSVLIYWVTSGGILLFAGFTLLTVGSMMSLIKSKEQIGV
ncbi:MAG: hypothetical protein J6B80_03475 [Clostridia bacterium]|nr:hypothetical protein [Clostridia bacterium]